MRERYSGANNYRFVLSESFAEFATVDRPAGHVLPKHTTHVLVILRTSLIFEERSRANN